MELVLPLSLTLAAVGAALILGLESGTPHLLGVAIGLELAILSLITLAAGASAVSGSAGGATLALALVPVAGAESAVVLAHLIGLSPRRGTVTLA